MEEGFLEGVEPLADVADGDEQRVIVGRIAEPVQADEQLMSALRRVGALPGKVVTVTSAASGFLVASAGESAEVDVEAASHLFVRRL